MGRIMVICLIIYLSAFISVSQEIVINEIMYNPVEPSQDSTEFIELVNWADHEIDLSNWRLVSAVNYLFPAGTSLAPGNYLLTAGDSVKMKKFYGLAINMHQWSGTLRNEGELIVLLDANEDTVDVVDYDNDGAWPREPDGSGPSLELLSPALDNADASNWRSSDTLRAPFGTPGAENSVFSGMNTPPQITSTPVTNAFITALYEYQVSALDEDGDTLIFLLNTTAAFLNIDSLSGMITGIPANEDKGSHSVIVTVYDTQGGSAAQVYNLLVLESQGVFDIVINEIMYNPMESGTDTTEYIELFNLEDRSIDIGGWSFLKGVVYTFPIPTILSAGEFLVVTKDSNACKNIYGNLERILQWTSGVLVNSGESIVLVNALGTLVDSVRYGTKGDWPSQPNGGGASLELIQPSLDNNFAENWAASEPADAPRGTPGKINSVFIKSLEERLFINELMNNNQNTIKDSTDNNFDSWIELYNKGVIDINLLNFYLTDDADNPVKWQLPDLAFQAGTFLLIWCDGDSNDSGLHTNFKLTPDNKYLGLYYATTRDTIIIDTLSFNLQTPDISYGRDPDGGENFVFFTNPTPAASNVSGIVTAMVPEQSCRIKTFTLYQNYPNPFNPATIIPFHLPEASRVKINVYNILGQQVEEVINKQYNAGYHEVHFGNSNYANGIYIIRAIITSEKRRNHRYIFTHKALLVK